MASVAPEFRLGPDARVAIIGGGPAGSFFALHLLRFARQNSLPLQVTIFERKDFRKRGSPGCNKCAGILSTRLSQGLHELALDIPQNLIMAELEGYTLHLAGGQVEVQRPDPSHRIISAYRGGGPLHSQLSPEVSFDAWLLDEARSAGAQVVAANVRRLRTGQRMRVALGDAETDEEGREFELVVLAGGVNARAPAMEGLDYQAPRTAVMAQDELALATPLDSAGRQQVQVFAGAEPGLLFGALIPKGDLVNVSLLGEHLGSDAVGQFLRQPAGDWWAEVGGERICGCRPKINIGPARHPFANRFVAIGDAAVTRLYKDGIGSAFVTARQAARTAIYDGVSAAAFRRGYAPLCRSIARDNHFGRALFQLWEHSQAHRFWSEALLHALQAEQRLPLNRRHGHMALWDILTGSRSYTAISRSLLHPATVLTFVRAMRTSG